jgi:3-hydroxyisobutyrate dehydrogenase
VEGARNGTLAMMVGGEPEVLERVRPALEAMAAHVVHMGASGAGQATKAVNQIMVAGINQAVTEALAFGAAQGLDLGRVIDVVGRGAAGNWFLTHRGPGMIEDRYPPGFQVALHRKDLQICQAMAHRQGVALSLVEQTLGDYQRLIDRAHGGEDISALYRLKKEVFGL